MEILPRAYPFREITREDVHSVLGMLAGDFEHDRDIPVRPRILYDRIHGRVEGDGYSRMLAVSAGGAIPDKGLYTVRTGDGVKVGEVDEEFVYESQKGRPFSAGRFCREDSGYQPGFGHRCPGAFGGSQSAVLERRVKRKGSSYQ